MEMEDNNKVESYEKLQLLEPIMLPQVSASGRVSAFLGALQRAIEWNGTWLGQMPEELEDKFSEEVNSLRAVRMYAVVIAFSTVETRMKVLFESYLSIVAKRISPPVTLDDKPSWGRIKKCFSGCEIDLQSIPSQKRVDLLNDLNNRVKHHGGLIEASTKLLESENVLRAGANVSFLTDQQYLELAQDADKWLAELTMMCSNRRRKEIENQ